MDVEQRVGRALALEADHAAVEPEDPAGEIVIALHEVGAAGEARRVGETADLKIGPPAAADSEAGHIEVAARELEVELPMVNRGGLDHVLGVEARLVHVQLRDRRRGARPAELEAALVELEVAGNRAAVRIRSQLQRSRDPRRHVVAVEEQRLVGVERQIEQRIAAGEGHGAIAADRTAAGGLPVIWPKISWGPEKCASASTWSMTIPVT